eukprot:354010-Chlamydomonas_euryale.AAC.7
MKEQVHNNWPACRLCIILAVSALHLPGSWVGGPRARQQQAGRVHLQMLSLRGLRTRQQLTWRKRMLLVKLSSTMTCCGMCGGSSASSCAPCGRRNGRGL